MTYHEALAALQLWVGRGISAHIEGPGPPILAEFEGTMTAAHDLNRTNEPVASDAGVFVMFDNAVIGFMLDPPFVSRGAAQ